MTTPAPLAERIGEVLALADKAARGPWEIDHSWDEDLAADHVYINSPEHLAFAQIVWRMDGDEKTPECEDTANFLAAVPTMADLLRESLAENERLKDALAELHAYSRTDGDYRGSPCEAKVIAALGPDQ